VLVLLDLGLPGEDGFSIARQLREHWRCGLVIVTGRGDAVDKVVGLEVGADDYVTKPFSVAELVARVEALLRRSGAHRAAPVAVFAFGAWQIDPAERLARRGDDEVALTPRELGLLALFAAEPGRILGRRRLLREVWGFGEPERIETRTVDMHIAKLRKKLGDAAAGIETVRGEGYRFSG
jgi:DNA-binding response OmpR family regulator